MIYQERKITKYIKTEFDKDFIEHNWEYKCEDLFGEAIITSINKLDGDTLDELVCDIIMAKQLKKGHTPDYEISFEATFKSQWKEVEDHKQEKVELKNIKNRNWITNLLSKIKKYVSS